MFGTVKWFNVTKGYGFIAPDDGSQDVFVHATQLERSRMAPLAEGQRVEFDKTPSVKDRRKTEATNLKPA